MFETDNFLAIFIKQDNTKEIFQYKRKCQMLRHKGINQWKDSLTFMM